MNALTPHRGSVAIAALAAACAFGLAVALLAGKASATPTYVDTTSVNGSVTLDPGSIKFSNLSSSTVAFGDGTGHFQLTGSQEVVASNAGLSFDVTDATGSGNGWTVSASAPTFTCSTGSCATPPAGSTTSLGILQVNGSSSPTVASPLTAACDPSCVGPGTSNYGSTIITVGTSTAPATPIFDQPVAKGMGKVLISNVYWLLTIPYNAVAGLYSSTITLNTSSGPNGA